MIKVKRYEDLLYPAIECEQCGKEIKSAGDGSCLFKVAVDQMLPLDGQVTFLHKDCTKGFERSHEGEWHWCWMPLESLVNNLFPKRAEGTV
jgi:hypothetical protein